MHVHCTVCSGHTVLNDKTVHSTLHPQIQNEVQSTWRWQNEKVKTKFCLSLSWICKHFKCGCLQRQVKKKIKKTKDNRHLWSSQETEGKAASQDGWSVCSLHAQTGYHLNTSGSIRHSWHRSEAETEKSDAALNIINIGRGPWTQHDSRWVSRSAT